MRKTLLSTAVSTALAGTFLSSFASQPVRADNQVHRKHLEEIVVHALPFQRTSLQAAEPVQVMAGKLLDDSRGLTLGETLQHQPGVQSSYYGPGSARPIIRGLGGPRVTILEDGLSTADGSAPSDDHAVTLDPMLVDQIEVLRGPATLLYGSGAVGGVVNVIDNRIPDSVPEKPVSGRFEAKGNSVADERTSSLRLDGGQGRFAWHLDGSVRDAGDTEIPGRARLEREDEHETEQDHDLDHENEQELDAELGPRGRLENSFVESSAFTLGSSWVGEQGFIGGSVRQFDTEYGIPAPHAHDAQDHENEEDHELEEEHEAEEDHEQEDHASNNEFAAIDMKQRSWDIKAGWEQPNRFFQSAGLRLGYNDYEHREFDIGGGEDEHGQAEEHEQEDEHEQELLHEQEGSLFEIDTFQARLELETQAYAGWNGALGFDYKDQDFEVQGAEAFIPDHETRSWALFALQERLLGPVKLSLGARFEDTEVEVTETGLGDERSFSSWSLAAGGVWEINDAWQTSLNLTRSERAPSGTELFANGPHLATFSFEVGDPSLTEEVTQGIDFGVHRHLAGLDLEATFFYKDIDDFVLLDETGQERDGLPLRVTRQQDAEFYGLELQANWQIHATPLGNFDLRAGYDQVRGELDSGGYLPRISPDRVKLGLDWHQGAWRAKLDWHRVEEQDKVADFEMPTDSYELVSAGLVYELSSSLPRLELFLQGNNLTDEKARVHTSFLKDFAPLPGRNITAGVRGRF